MWRQMQFLDHEGNTCGGFIKTDPDTGEILEAFCGCCGGVFPIDELGETWKLVHIFQDWANLTPFIIYL